ncbi:MAG: MFS transporter [Thalassobius sp.]|nr:MFS transporter [Thalassovita sp.]
MRFKKTLFILSLGTFGITNTEFSVIGILPDLAKAFDVSISKAGWLLSVFAIIVAVFGPFMMMVLSSINKKKLLVFSLLVFTVANFLTPLMEQFSHLLIVRMLPAFFHPVYWSIALSITRQNSHKSEVAKNISVIFAGLTIATVMGIPLATLTSSLLNWKFSFIISGFINLISMIGIVIYLPSKDELNTKIKFDYQFLKNKILWLNFLLVFLIITAMYATYGYMADFLKSVSGLSGEQISIMFLIFGFTGIFGNKIAGKYMDKSPKKTTLYFIIALLITHVLLNYFSVMYMALVVIILLWGLIHSGGFLISNVVLTSIETENQEMLNTIFTSCGNFAVTAGSIIGGYWIANNGIETVAWASIVILCLSLIVLRQKLKLSI